MSLIVPDTYDKLFLQCNNVTTSNSTAFLDTSTANPKTIAANGNATQLSSGWTKNTAMFFDGVAGTYVLVPDSADFDFAANLSIETDLVFNSVSGSQSIYNKIDGNPYPGLGIQYEAGTGIVMYLNSGSASKSWAWSPSVNVKYAFKVTRVSGVFHCYIDNSEIGTSYSNSNAVGATTANLVIGAARDFSNRFSGWMKNYKVINGTTTVLELKADSSATSPLGPAIAFDGTGDYLTVPNGGSFDVGAGDFTLDASIWVPAGLADTNYYFWSQGPASASILVNLYLGATNACNIYLNNSSKLSVAMGFRTNSWNPIRLQRSGGYLRIFNGGVQMGSVADTTNITASSATDITIGVPPFAGYVREIRFQASAQDGNTTYSPSQTGFTVDANTKLYIKGNGNNGVTTFIDSETSPKTVTTVGDTKIKYTEDYRSCIFMDETGKFPYPVGSAKVDFFAIGSGVGSFGTSNATNISTPDSDDFNMTADHTLEGYFRITDTSKGAIIAVQGQDATNGWWFGYQNTAPHYRYYVGNSSLFDLTVSWTPLANTWYHFAATRYGNVWNIWANGSSIVTSTTSVTVPNLTGNFCVGADTTTFGNYTQGFLDNIRISKGVARYTATFNPPEDFQTTTIKSVAGVAYASIKSVSGVAVAGIKNVAGVA